MTLPPLALAADVEARLGRNLTATEVKRLAPLLADASAAVRLRAGQQFTAGTSTQVLPIGPSRKVRLPQRPVTAIDEVVDPETDVALTYIWWDQSETIEVRPNVIDAWSFEPFHTNRLVAKVTYQHGYDVIPSDIVAVVCQIAARALGRPADQSGITQENIDGYGYSIGSAAAAGGLGMLPAEAEVCDRYRRPVPAIQT